MDIQFIGSVFGDASYMFDLLFVRNKRTALNLNRLKCTKMFPNNQVQDKNQ